MRISDWSSDVCSSDLLVLECVGPLQELQGGQFGQLGFDPANGVASNLGMQRQPAAMPYAGGFELAVFPGLQALVVSALMQMCIDQAVRNEIGRASCRERVCQYV